MIQIALHRNLAGHIARSDVRPWELGDRGHGWQDKSPDLRRGHVVGWIECFAHSTESTCWRSGHKAQRIQCIKRRRQHFRGRRAP
jgi:hypothetical protein